MRFWLSGPRLFHGMVRPGVSFGQEDFRSLGIVGYAVLEIVKFVIAIPLAVVVWFCFYLIAIIITGAI
jgi:hypothetical protein